MKVRVGIVRDLAVVTGSRVGCTLGSPVECAVIDDNASLVLLVDDGPDFPLFHDRGIRMCRDAHNGTPADHVLREVKDTMKMRTIITITHLLGPGHI